MYDLVRRLYGIEVKQETGIPVWDPAVTDYTIYKDDGDRLGSFYADFFPRENKRDGAWMDSLLIGVPGGEYPHLGFICGNLTPPVDRSRNQLIRRSRCAS